MPEQKLDTHDEVDNMDLNNYKGIYANEEAGQKYTCPQTGAHFEYKDISRRMIKLSERRQLMDK